MLFWLVGVAARASVPVAEPPLALPEPAISLALGPVDGGVVVVGGATALRAYTAPNGPLVESVPGWVADAVILVDRDADGRADVVTCGDAGLGWIPWPAGGWQAPIVLDPEPCGAVVALAGGLAAAGTDVRIYQDDGTGGVLPGPTRYAGTPSILASRGTDLAWTSPGDTVYAEVGPYGVSSLPVGGAVTGIAASDGGWWLAWDATLRDTAGLATPLADPPGPIASGDVDLDGVLDVVVTHPDLPELAIHTVAGETRVAVATGTTRVATGDLDGDGCADVAVDDPAGVLVVRMTDCVPPTDSDGDGWSTPIDCDDSDPDVHPGAPEACGAGDEDCDGEVDEVGELALAGPPVSPVEGEQILVSAKLSGCRPDGATAAWTSDGPAACTFSAFDAICTGDDQGTTRLAVTVTADGALLGAAEGDVAWLNVAPDFDGDRFFAVTAGISEVFTVEASDVPADRVTFASPDLPSWVTLSEDGSIAIDAPEPLEQDVTIVASDEDGGETERVYTILADPADDTGVADGGAGCDGGFDLGCDGGCCCGCGGSGGAAIVPLWGLLAYVRGRRRIA